MVKYTQIGMGSPDCTYMYCVEISKPMKVKDFISELLETYPKEWGYIGIYSTDKTSTFGKPHCEYSYGKLESELPEEYL